MVEIVTREEKKKEWELVAKGYPSPQPRNGSALPARSSTRRYTSCEYPIIREYQNLTKSPAMAIKQDIHK